MNHRWYDPESGRFTTEDPIGSGNNWYGYCGNSPLTHVDPWGLVALEEGETWEPLDIDAAGPADLSTATGGRRGGDRDREDPGPVSQTLGSITYNGITIEMEPSVLPSEDDDFQEPPPDEGPARGGREGEDSRRDILPPPVFYDDGVYRPSRDSYGKYLVGANLSTFLGPNGILDGYTVDPNDADYYVIGDSGPLIKIIRNIDPQKYQTSAPPAYYQDTLEVWNNDILLLSIKVQASASKKGPTAYGVIVENLAEGFYTGTLETLSGNGFYKNIIRINETEILVHPNFKNAIAGSSEWNAPCSAGCTVSNRVDFNRLVSTLQGIGLTYRPKTDGAKGLDTITIQYVKNY